MTNKRLPGDTYHDAYRDYLRAVLNKAEKNRSYNQSGRRITNKPAHIVIKPYPQNGNH